MKTKQIFIAFIAFVIGIGYNSIAQQSPERTATALGDGKLLAKHGQLKKLIADVEKARADKMDTVRFERWRTQIILRLNDMFPGEYLGNRFSDATEDYGSYNSYKDTPQRRYASGLGYLEGLVLLDDLLKKPQTSEIQAQLRRFRQEAETNSALRKDDNDFSHWGMRVRAYLQYGVSQETSVEIANAMTDYSGTTVADKLGRAMGVLDSLIDRRIVKQKAVKTPEGENDAPSRSSVERAATASNAKGDRPARDGAGKLSPGQIEILQIIADAESDRKMISDEASLERWRQRVQSQLDVAIDRGIANRFSDATYMYDSHKDTPEIRFENGLGYLEGLLLFKDPKSGATKAESQNQVRQFVKEANKNSELNKNQIAFTRWAHRVEAYLDFGVSGEAAVEFNDATSSSDETTLRDRLKGASEVLNSVMGAKPKKEREDKVSESTAQAVPPKQTEGTVFITPGRGRNSEIVFGKALLPPFQRTLKGSHEVRVVNPNEFLVKAGVRSDNSGKDFEVRAGGTESIFVPNGRYDIYFIYSDRPDDLYQGDSFTISGNGVQITITKVINGNYGIRKAN